jgi:hypothetical protein
MTLSHSIGWKSLRMTSNCTKTAHLHSNWKDAGMHRSISTLSQETPGTRLILLMEGGLARMGQDIVFLCR